MFSRNWTRLPILVVASLLWAVAGPAGGREYCDPCLAQALEANGRGTLEYIEKLWTQYRALAPRLKEIETRGTDAEKAAAQAFLARWREAKQLARAYQSGEFALYLEADKKRLTARVEETRAAQQREQAILTRLVRSANNTQERAAAMKEMQDYTREAERLLHDFNSNLKLAGFRGIEAVNHGAVEAVIGRLESAALGPAARQRAEALITALRAERQVVGAVVYGAEQKHNAEVLERALAENRRGEALGAAATATAETSLQVMRLMSDIPRFAANFTPAARAVLARVGMYASIAALTMDNLMIESALRRQRDTERRQLDLDYNAGVGRLEARVWIRTSELNAAKRRLELVEKDIGYRREIAKLYVRITADDPR